MNDLHYIQYLLNHVSTITKKNNEILEAIGGRFNMFRLLGVDHYEVSHSAILAEFLNPKGSHGLKEKFLQAFVDQLKLPDSPLSFNFENSVVITEAPTIYGRIDILITDNNGHAIIIENKIYASDQAEQLKRYNEFAKQKFGKSNYEIYYLTLTASSASEHSGGGVDYRQISYAGDIINWLENCINLASRFPMVRETINQYINHLKQLTNQDMDRKNQEELAALLSKPENIEAAFKISENINQLKHSIVTDMAKYVAEKCSVEFKVSADANGIFFYKKEWKQGAGIYFSQDKLKTYYSIKTHEAITGRAILQFRIEELFEKKEDRYNPYGFGYVLNDHWSNNSELYIKMVNGSLAEKIFIPNLDKVLNYLEINPEIENKLKL